jgi:DNA primase
MTLNDLLARHTGRIDEKRWRNPTGIAGEFFSDGENWAVVRDRSRVARGGLIELFKELHGTKEILLVAEELGGREAVESRLSHTELITAKEGELRCKIVSEASEYYYAQLRATHEGKALFADRGLSEENMETLRCGWAGAKKTGLFSHLAEKGFATEDITGLGLACVLKEGRRADKFTNRMVLPVFSEFGYIVGLNARRTGDEEEARSKGDFSAAQKYLLSANCDKSEHPELLARALETAKKTGSIVFCEGKFDAVTARKAGFNAIALNGASASEMLIHRISNLGLRAGICLDYDKAGRTQTAKILRQFWKHGAKPVVAAFPGEAKDIDEFVRKMNGKASDVRWVKGVDRVVADMEFLKIDWKDLSKDFADHGDMLRAVNLMTQGLGMDAESLAQARESATREVLSAAGLATTSCARDFTAQRKSNDAPLAMTA